MIGLPMLFLDMSKVLRVRFWEDEGDISPVQVSAVDEVDWGLRGESGGQGAEIWREELELSLSFDTFVSL